MIPEVYTSSEAMDICVKIYVTKLNEADLTNPTNVNKWNFKNWNIPLLNRNPKTPSDLSLIDFCYGRQPDELTARQIVKAHDKLLDGLKKHAKSNVKYGVSASEAIHYFAEDMCTVKCIPWWRNNGKIYRFIDNGLLYTLNYSHDDFTSAFHTESDPLAFCVKEYTSWSSSTLVKLWSRLGLGVFKFATNNFLKDFCFGRKPDPLTAQKMEKNYKNAVNAHMNLAKRNIKKGGDALVAVNRFASQLCTQICLPWWNANARVHHYIYDGN